MKRKVRRFIEERNSIPRTNHDKDLSKFYAQQKTMMEGSTPTKQLQCKPFWKKTWFWAIAPMAVAIAIILPLVLIFGRTTKQETVDNIYFCDNAQIQYIPISSQSDFNSKHSCNSAVRTDSESTYAEMFSEELNKVIALKTDLFIYNELFHEASVISYIGNDRVVLGQYSTFDEQINLNGLTVKYQLTHMAGMSVYYLNWSSGSIEYYATVLAYLDVDINEALNQVFLLQ